MRTSTAIPAATAEAILTRDHLHAQQFLREVDSSSVMVNTSTRFADGFEYGLGAEIGISTDKFHARGPVGMEGLTSLKYIVLGEGQVRQVNRLDHKARLVQARNTMKIIILGAGGVGYSVAERPGV